MLEQKQHVANFLFFAQCDELLLQAHAGGVVDSAELDNGDQIPPAADLRGFTRSRVKITTTEDREGTKLLASLGRNFDIG